MSKSNLESVARAPIDDDTLRDFVGYHLKRSFNVIQADLTQVLKPLELRLLTYTALVLVVDNPGLSQTQLAAAMDIERPNLVVIVDELEQRGLIVRARVQTDRRLYALRATAAGKRLCRKALAADRAHEAKLLDGLDCATRRQLVSTLSTLREHLDQRMEDND